VLGDWYDEHRDPGRNWLIRTSLVAARPATIGHRPVRLDKLPMPTYKPRIPRAADSADSGGLANRTAAQIEGGEVPPEDCPVLDSLSPLARRILAMHKPSDRPQYCASADAFTDDAGLARVDAA
jgi:hypothetical protein